MKFLLLGDVCNINVDDKVKRAAVHPVDTVTVDLEPHTVPLLITGFQRKMDGSARLHQGQVLFKGEFVFFRHTVGQTAGKAVTAKKSAESVIGLQKLQVPALHHEFGREAGKIIIGNRLLLLNTHQVVNIGNTGVGNLTAVYILIRKCCGKFHPYILAVFPANT